MKSALAAIGTAAVLAGCGVSGSAPSPVSPSSATHNQAAAPAGGRLSMTLVLGNGAAGAKAATATATPGSPQFRRFLAPAQFGARYGLNAQKQTALIRQLKHDGLTVTNTFPQRTELIANGPRRTVERLLHTRIVNHAPTRTPVVPSKWRSAVSAVTGLDTRTQWQPRDVPTGGITPQLAAKAYDLHGLGSGAGGTIAIISFSAFDPSDPAAYIRHYGINPPQPQVIPVDGGTTSMAGQSETDLDIEMVQAVAPKAQILIYESPQTSSGYADTINKIVADGRAKIVSTSWGECELAVHPSEFSADQQAFSAAVASGVTMFSASGDSGAYDCQRLDPTVHQLTADWPTSSDSVVSVGGTRLYLSGDGSYSHETGWEGQLSDAGGGGGVSAVVKQPGWQKAPGVQGSWSNGNRQVPDVAADADPGTGWSTFAQGQPGEAGGTSAAAPFWAASMLLAQQYVGKQVGFVAPLLYKVAAKQQPYAAFHDVTEGGNRRYQAAPGWDPATGLGSPDVYNLARDLKALLG